MSASTWDTFSSSSSYRHRQQYKRRQAVYVAKPAVDQSANLVSIASPLQTQGLKLAEIERQQSKRTRFSVVAFATTITAAHVLLAVFWDNTPSLIAAPKQVVIEFIKPKEIEPPKPPEPIKPPKPLPQKLQTPPPTPQVQRQEPPAPQPTSINTTSAVTIPVPPPAPPAPIVHEPETITPPVGYAGYLHNPPPAYPAAAIRLGMEGKVILKVLVQANGKAATVEVKTSSGKKMLDEAAIAAVQGWVFSPAKRGQTPIEGWATVPVEFKLER